MNGRHCHYPQSNARSFDKCVRDLLPFFQSEDKPINHEEGILPFVPQRDGRKRGKLTPTALSCTHKMRRAPKRGTIECLSVPRPRPFVLDSEFPREKTKERHLPIRYLDPLTVKPHRGFLSSRSGWGGSIPQLDMLFKRSYLQTLPLLLVLFAAAGACSPRLRVSSYWNILAGKYFAISRFVLRASLILHIRVWCIFHLKTNLNSWIIRHQAC